MKIKYQAIPASMTGVALHDRSRNHVEQNICKRVLLSKEHISVAWSPLRPEHTPGNSIPELPTGSPLDGADAMPCPNISAIFVSLNTHDDIYFSQRPQPYQLYPILAEPYPTAVVSRCIHRDAYPRGPLAILVLNAPVPLRRLVVPLNGLAEREHLGSA
jgi:hypothetical protein